VNKEHGRSRMRLCFASPSHEEIHQGVAALAEVCRRDFGLKVPTAKS
jgi:2-aminoadipate transaminase